MDCDFVVIASVPDEFEAVSNAVPSGAVKGCGWAGVASVWTDSPACAVAALLFLWPIAFSSTQILAQHYLLNNMII
jgi:hypothetical protein